MHHATVFDPAVGFGAAGQRRRWRPLGQEAPARRRARRRAPHPARAGGAGLSLAEVVPSDDPDGLFGPETFNAVYALQKREFPGQYGQWDGRVGKNTLAKMDAKHV